LETIIAKITSFEEEEQAQKILTPESSNNDILTPFPSNVTLPNTNALAENAPFLSLFDNSVVSISPATTRANGKLMSLDWATGELNSVRVSVDSHIASSRQ